MNPRPSLLDALHRTLRSVTEAERLNADDFALAEFKRSLVRMIAELEMREAASSEAA
jgi:hypothetical protein